MSSPVKSPVQKKMKGDGNGALVDNAGMSSEDDIPAMPPMGMEEPKGAFGPRNEVRAKEVVEDEMPKWAKTLKPDILKGFDSVIDNKLTPIKSDISDMKAEITNTKNTAEQAKHAVSNVNEEVQKLRVDVEKRIEDIEKVIKPEGGSKSTSVVVGGLGQNCEEANRWLFEQLKRFELTAPLDTYYKGDDFKGMLFCKFPNPQAATTAIETFNSKAIKFKDQPVWCKHDLPLEPRTCRSFLLGLRRLLIKWECFAKKQIKVDDDSTPMSLEVDKKLILTASVVDGAMSLSWHDKAWEEWKELHAAEEYKALMDTACEKLKDAAQKRSKGTGKGKVGRKGDDL